MFCVCFLTCPLTSSLRRRDLCSQLRQWQLKVIDNVKRGQHKKSLEKLFQGFKPAVEACYFNWEEAYPIPGITYSSSDKKNSFCWVKAIQQRSLGTGCGPLPRSQRFVQRNSLESGKLCLKRHRGF